jgi:CRP-like cAMP-binding protein
LHPTITIALWRETLIDAAIFREWIVNVGRRDALGAMAHFLLEQAKRLQAVGLGSETEFELPLTQGDLADVLGLTPIHVNRVLRSLRERAIVRVIKQRVQILDLPGMKEIAGFESSYLHEGPRS